VTGVQKRTWTLPGCFFERARCTFRQFPCTFPEVRMPERIRLTEEEWAYLLYWLTFHEMLI
jgi:hypothetical protein